MVIRGIDKKKTFKLKKNAERNKSRLQRMKKQKVNAKIKLNQVLTKLIKKAQIGPLTICTFHFKTTL